MQRATLQELASGQRASCRRVWLRVLALVAAGAAWLGPAAPAAAHDMPDELLLQMFVKPGGDEMAVVARLPLAFLLDSRMPKRGPGYIDLAQRDLLDPAIDASARQVADQIRLFEGDARLRVERQQARLSLPADRSFVSYESAVAHVAGPGLPVTTNLFWNQGYFDVHLAYARAGEGAAPALQFGAEPQLARRVHMLVTYLGPEGRTRSYDVLGTAGRVPLDPSWLDAAGMFAAAGWQRATTGPHQLLFLLLVALGFRRQPRRFLATAPALIPALALAMVPAVAVTVAEDRWTATLVGAAVAVSLLALAIGNLLAEQLRWRPLVVAGAALAHGAALSSGLYGVLQFRSAAFPVALAAYAAGVAAALLLMIVVLRGALGILAHHPLAAGRAALVTSALAGHEAWHWTTERVGLLRTLPRPGVPVLDPFAIARVIVVALLLLAVAWFALEVAATRRAKRVTAGLRPQGGPVALSPDEEPVDA